MELESYLKMLTRLLSLPQRNSLVFSFVPFKINCQISIVPTDKYEQLSIFRILLIAF